MKYTEVVYPTKHGPEHAIGVNDFDSMALRLTQQLTHAQIMALVNQAEQAFGDYIEWAQVTPEDLSYGRVRA